MKWRNFPLKLFQLNSQRAATKSMKLILAFILVFAALSQAREGQECFISQRKFCDIVLNSGKYYCLGDILENQFRTCYCRNNVYRVLRCGCLRRLLAFLEPHGISADDIPLLIEGNFYCDFNAFLQWVACRYRLGDSIYELIDDGCNNCFKLQNCEKST